MIPRLPLHTKLLRALRKGLRLMLRHGDDALAASLLLFGLSIVFLEMASRTLQAGSFMWSEELSRYCLIWMTYFAVAAAVRDNSNIRVSIGMQMLPFRGQRALEFLVCLLSLGFAATVSWAGWHWIEGTRLLGLRSADSNLALPIWLFQSIIPIGFALISLRLVERMVRLWKNPDLDPLGDDL